MPVPPAYIAPPYLLALPKLKSGFEKETAASLSILMTDPSSAMLSLNLEPVKVAVHPWQNIVPLKAAFCLKVDPVSMKAKFGGR